MIRITFFFIAFILCSYVWGQNSPQLIISGKTINTQEHWRGTVIIEGDVIVAPNGRLVIEAGSSILFRANMDKQKSGRDQTRAELIVYGTLMARGSINQKIRFSSAAAAPRMQDWYGISITSPNQTSVIDYAIIEFAFNGVHIKKSNPQISNAQIQFNYNAGIVAEVEAAPKILGNIISENDYAGLICNTGAQPFLSDNMIAQNQIGVIIFGTAQPNLGSLTRDDSYNIGRNALVNNREYNIHNHSSQNIKAENNSWGVPDAPKIALTVYDFEDDKKYGKISIGQVLNSALNLEDKILLAQTNEQPTRQSILNNRENTANPIQIDNVSTTALNNNPPPVSNESRSDRTLSENQISRQVADSQAIQAKINEQAILLADASRLEIKSQGDPARQGAVDKTKTGADWNADPAAGIDYSQVFLDAFLDQKSEIRRKVAPVVQDNRLGLGQHGRIIVRVVVAKDGRVESANILRGLNPYYDEISLKAAKQFEFKSGMINGKSVRFATSIFFEF